MVLSARLCLWRLYLIFGVSRVDEVPIVSVGSTTTGGG